MKSLLIFPERKTIRAQVIRDYMKAAGYRRAVCFSCGNASRALAEAGVDTLDISAGGKLEATGWWTPAEIHRTWPTRFDATSGHAPTHLLGPLSKAFRDFLGPLDAGPYEVTTGSGETITALRIAYPHLDLAPAYGTGPHDRREPLAPMNGIVDAWKITTP